MRVSNRKVAARSVDSGTGGQGMEPRNGQKSECRRRTQCGRPHRPMRKREHWSKLCVWDAVICSEFSLAANEVLGSLDMEQDRSERREAKAWLQDILRMALLRRRKFRRKRKLQGCRG